MSRRRVRRLLASKSIAMPVSRECTKELSLDSPKTTSAQTTPVSGNWTDRWLIEHLKADLNVPDHFIDLAIKIWWDGKED